MSAVVALLALQAASVAGAGAGMTAHAVRDLAVDWRVQVEPGTDPGGVLGAVRADPGTAWAIAIGVGHGGELSTGARVSGPAVLVGLPDDYRGLFPGELRPVAGADRGVLLPTRTAQELRAGPGTVLSVDLIGGAATALRVDGIVDLPAGSALNRAAAGSQPVGPVVLVPDATWQDLFAPLASAAGSADLVRTEVVVARSHDLPAVPAVALREDVAAARRIERAVRGAVVVDDLGAALDAARAESVSALFQLAFLPLAAALPAGLLSAEVGMLVMTRRRGARSGDGWPSAVAAGSVGLASLLVGLGVAAVAARLSTVPMSGSVLVWLVVAAAIGPLAAVAALGAAVPPRRPVRLAGLDVVLLGAGTLLVRAAAVDGWGTGPGLPAGAGPPALLLGGGLLVWRLAAAVPGSAPSAGPCGDDEINLSDSPP